MSDQIDENDENVVYIEPNIDYELPKDKRQTCRDIVKEIKEFGVNQRQILFLIQLLTMELENRDALQAISKAIGEVRNAIPSNNKLILSEQPKNAKKLVF